MSHLTDKLSIHTAVTIDPTLTAEDWDLYATQPTAQRAAAQMNFILKSAVNTGEGRDTVESRMDWIMRIFEDVGATDTEPRYVLADILDEIFGEK